MAGLCLILNNVFGIPYVELILVRHGIRLSAGIADEMDFGYFDFCPIKTNGMLRFVMAEDNRYLLFPDSFWCFSVSVRFLGGCK